MPQLRATLPVLSALPAFDDETGDVNVVIETPKGSGNKYDYDAGCGAFRLADVMHEGQTFPFDFGFVPATLAEDGDPIDVLVLMDAPVPMGCVLTARLIGAIEAKQRSDGEPWERNDRLLAVATHARTHQHRKSLADLRPHQLDEIETFFVNYAGTKGKTFKPLKRAGPKAARKLVKQAMKAFAKKKR
jgi:inorganic pyrophosphatase